MKINNLDEVKIIYQMQVVPCDMEVSGNAIASGDAEADKQVEDQICKELEAGNLWAWCDVTVTATVPGIDLKGTATLGACSYKDQRAFEEDAYYQDLKNEAKQDLLDQINRVKNLKVDA